jgi:hypothetical protein
MKACLSLPAYHDLSAEVVLGSRGAGTCAFVAVWRFTPLGASNAARYQPRTLQRRISLFAALPIDALDRMTLTKRVQDIGNV